ncbi:restriction endonuclease [Polynucleobacter paneuropaeus]|nr:restriction endonuclease [Polynucleobacter paneuropaeus]
MSEINYYNPDVLTCLANLSNDEVFTPPQLANQILDLLPKGIWSDKNARFLDPFSKSGIFLREVTRRLDVGLAGEIPDQQDRINHILTKQVFGIAITELTSLLSRRSVYCSKSPNGRYSIVSSFKDDSGNIKFDRTEHTWKSGRCTYCGASQTLQDRGIELETHAYQFIHTKKPQEIFNMKFDVIVGNPPYQLKDGGAQASASPIYQLFVNQAKKLNPKYLLMIIPARWYAGGKGLDEFRNEMINDRHISHLVDFPKLFECFPGVEIKGGVCYFLRNSSHDGDCVVRTVIDGVAVSEMKRDLRETGDVLVRTNEAIPILKKVQAKGEPTLDGKVSSRKPFGIPTNDHGSKEKTNKNDIVLYRRGGASYCSPSDILVNAEWVPKWKVLTPMAGDGHGRVPMTVTGLPIVAPKNSACSETYLVVDTFDEEKIAHNMAIYLRTKFVRFLISLRKNTQHLINSRFSFVPDLDMTVQWSDKKLYARYGFSQQEIDFIEGQIKAMGSDSE